MYDEKEIKKIEKLPYSEQKEITDKHYGGKEIRKNYIKQVQDTGGKIMAVKNIKEAIAAEKYLKEKGHIDVKIVGGTARPVVSFR